MQSCQPNWEHNKIKKCSTNQEEPVLDFRLWQRWRCNQQDVGICSRKHFIHDSLTSVDGLTAKELYGVLFPNSQAECLLTNECHCMRQCYFSRVAWVCLNMLRPQSLSFEIFCLFGFIWHFSCIRNNTLTRKRVCCSSGYSVSGEYSWCFAG